MTHRYLGLAALLVTTAAAAVAEAHPAPCYECGDYAYNYTEPTQPPRPKDPWERLRFEGGVGALIGSQRVGYVAGTAGGVHFDAGVRRNRLYPFLEYDFLSVGESSYEKENPVRGYMHRFSANLRYSLGAFGGHGDVPVRGDIWAEVGLGHQMINWHEGGRLNRKDISLGFGAQATFRIGKVRPRYVGVYYAMKASVAVSPDRKDDSPVCAGPCDMATGPSPWDFGVYFNFGVPFGR